jgi:hypothetical protein
MTPPRSAAVIASLVGPPKDEDDRLVSRRICFSARRRRRSCRHCAPRSGCCVWSQRLRSNTAGYATAEEIYRVVKVVLQVRFAAVLSRTNGSVTSLPTRHRDATTSMLRIQAAIALAASRHPNLCDFVAFKYSVARCSKMLERRESFRTHEGRSNTLNLRIVLARATSSRRRSHDHRSITAPS